MLHVNSFVGGLVPVNSRQSNQLILSFVWVCNPLYFLHSFPQLLHLDPHAQSDGWLYLNLYQSGAGRISQGTGIPGFFRKAFLGISNSVGIWNLQMGWITRCSGLWMAFPFDKQPLLDQLDHSLSATLLNHMYIFFSYNLFCSSRKPRLIQYSNTFLQLSLSLL